MIYPNFNSVIGAPQFPVGAPTIGSPLANPTPNAETVHSSALNGLKRAVSFAADHQGCGFWRMHWPESVINANQGCF